MGITQERKKTHKFIKVLDFLMNTLSYKFLIFQGLCNNTKAQNSKYQLAHQIQLCSYHVFLTEGNKHIITGNLVTCPYTRGVGPCRPLVGSKGRALVGSKGQSPWELLNFHWLRGFSTTPRLTIYQEPLTETVCHFFSLLRINL